MGIIRTSVGIAIELYYPRNPTMFPPQAGNIDIEALSGICGYVSAGLYLFSIPFPITTPVHILLSHSLRANG